MSTRDRGRAAHDDGTIGDAAWQDADPTPLGWVLLTVGTRLDELVAAVNSIRRRPDAAPPIVVVVNSDDGRAVADRLDGLDGVVVACPGANLGVPGGRHVGLQLLPPSVQLVGFLDDDARLLGDAAAPIRRAFDHGDAGAVTLRLVDEDGRTARRHVPRVGADSPERSGRVVNFLGGACAIRRSAYEEAGGYWSQLFYGHEELDLAWRLADRGWTVSYLADVRVFHPRTEISRHTDGWRLTGRNRVMIARRNLPGPLHVVHACAWLLLGCWRAPRGCRREYVNGWWSGWREPVDRAPIRWSTVWRLTRSGRPPIV